MLWTLDAGGFRQRSNQFESVEDVQEAVLHAASNVDSVSKIQEMAAVNPKERASAAQMLVKYYNGIGLITPRNQVPALISSPSPAITAARAPPPASPLTTRTTQTRPRRFQKNRNIFAAAQQAPRRLQGLRLKPDKS
ncbi:hypothetical protein G7Y89_g5511 [Cudoniella acicularis]|uniref:Uncharacterized protein n=1 Tax=Cudoniella acicularis TaxID=354080 RepID=A0A8H4RMC9_9HELO|nr:hypothetical protein G7Y89_g5511 [Cudoniella acicularis]